MIFFSAKGQLTITTTSSTEYAKDHDQAIYPAFVDDLPYQSWTEAGSKDFFQLKATGGNHYEWQLVEGKLPPGLSLTTNGKIQGTVTQEGTYTFTVKVKEGNTSATKKLTMTAEPYRARWYEEAKFGVNVGCGFVSEPRIVGSWTMPKEEIKAKVAQLEARMSAFNATKWAQQTADLGGKFLNYSVHSFDAWRMWPSTTPTNGELKTKRNYAGELIQACHAKKLKFIAYFAPDKGGNPGNTDYAVHQDSPDYDAWGTMNLGLVKELVQMGADGLWVDVGGTPEFYSVVDPKWFNWQKIVAYARTHNPHFIFFSNPGIRMHGALANYPYADVVVYEGEAHPNSFMLTVGNPSIQKKKMAVETSLLLDSEWAWIPSKGIPHVPAKDPDILIDYIKRNWANGVTVSLNWPVRPDGTFIVPEYSEALAKIGKFVKANQSYARTGTAGNAGKTGAATANRSLVTKAQKPVTTDRTGLTTLFSAIKDNVAQRDNEGNFRGMRIVVGAAPILIAAIGAPATEVTPEILIREYASDYPLLYDKASKKSATNVITIPETRLEAGHSYIITVKVKGNYQANPVNNPPVTTDLRVVEKFALNAYGNRIPAVKDGFGALLNLTYKVLANEKSTNLALGKPVALISNRNGKLLGPAAGMFYAENIVDGNRSTMGVGGDEYGSTVRVDLQKTTPIKQINVFFHPENFATEFEMYTSVDGVKLDKIASVKNSSMKKEFSFKPDKVACRYVYIKSIKPDGPKQPGTQMSIQELQVY